MSDCIPYEGYKTWDGYGLRGHIYIHVEVYERAHGPLPEGMEVDHTCKNTSCINVEHLEAVTPEENQRRTRTTHCPRGHEKNEQNIRVRRMVRVNGHGKRMLMTTRDCRVCNKERRNESRSSLKGLQLVKN